MGTSNQGNEITRGTILRTIVNFIAMVNLILTFAGKNPLPWSETEVYAGFSILFEIATNLVTWWKNNSFTKPAIRGDNLMEELRILSKL